MIPILCLDDNNGLLFNKRRQSQDRVLTKRILSLSQKSRLWCDAYSWKLLDETANEGGFPELLSHVTESPDCARKAGDGEYIFAEQFTDYASLLSRMEGLILFRWNRVYPRDAVFDASLLSHFSLKSTQEFAGHSHDKITMEVYGR